MAFRCLSPVESAINRCSTQSVSSAFTLLPDFLSEEVRRNAMILYVGLTQPVDKNTEEKIEAKILEWFQKFKGKLGLVGVFPYDPVMMEYAVDIGDQPCEPVVDSLERWIGKLNLDETDFTIGNVSILESMSREERTDHLVRKIRYIHESLHRLSRSTTNPTFRQIEYLLGGVRLEAEKLLRSKRSPSIAPTPVDERVSKKLDEFWRSL